MIALLHYNNIQLRPLEPEDIDILYQWENDMALWQVSNTKTPFSKHILKQYIEQSHKDIYETKQLRLIIENEVNNPVGAIDLFDFDPFHSRAGIGILIYQSENRQQQYAFHALKALEKYCIDILGMHQLFANIAQSNKASIQLFKKAGFNVIGIKKEWLKNKIGWEDEIMLQKIL